MSEESDQDLAARAGAGDRAAFAALAARHYDQIHALAWRWTGARARADDVAQETMVKLARAISAFRGECAFTSWIWRIAYNIAVDYMRRERKHQSLAQPLDLLAEREACHGDTPEDNMMNQDLWRAVRALPDPLRDAALLVYAQDLSHAEAAAIMGCSEKTASWRLHEARKRLRPILTVD